MSESGSERVHTVRQVQRTSQRREKRERVASRGGEAGALVFAFGVRRQPAGPQECADLFERHPADEVFDLVAANNQVAAFAVDVAQLRVGDDNAIQTAAWTRHAGLTIARDLPPQCAARTTPLQYSNSLPMSIAPKERSHRPPGDVDLTASRSTGAQGGRRWPMTTRTREGLGRCCGRFKGCWRFSFCSP